MQYTFEILGISPISYFFNQQQQIIEKKLRPGVEYLGTQNFTLDTLLESVDIISSKYNWDSDAVSDSVINFWVTSSGSIRYWKARLNKSGSEALLVARIAELNSLRLEFESLLTKSS